MDTEMDNRIGVPVGVLAGISEVRETGLTNMLDVHTVRMYCERLGYRNASRWIRDHEKEYAEGIIAGFKGVQQSRRRF